MANNRRNPSKQGQQNPFTNMITEAVDAILRNAMFSIPGRVTAFDPETQLAQVEIGIKYFVNGEATTLPPINDVPVCFPGDGKWYFWHQITPGETEGMIQFSQRAVDTWIDQGGPVAPHERRILSGNDAFFEPGYRSRPGAIPNFRNDGTGLSNYDGSTYIHLTSSGTEVENDMSVTGNLSVDGSISATGSISSDGNVEAAGNVAAQGDVTANGGAISLATHVHGGVTSGQSTTGTPQ